MSAGITLYGVATRSTRCATFVKVIEAAGLTETFRKKGQFTVFAPNEIAFGQLTAAQRDALLKDPVAAKRLVESHMVKGKLHSLQLRKKRSLKAIAGNTLTISAAEVKTMVNDAKITQEDNVGSNGILHYVDHLLVPAA